WSGNAMNSETPFQRLLAERILVLDGAMGTMLQSYRLDEAAYRGSRFAGHPKPVKGCVDLLSITRPDIGEEIHRKYFEAGAGSVGPTSFPATWVPLADYAPADHAYETTRAAAEAAVRAARATMARDPSRPRFVAGSMGPTNKTASLSPDVNDPGFRAVRF